ncbi:MAG TPA: efflux RND transporter periplasmic adaptor subunit [Pirellulales bacterium]|nr:efflux RND transporter periplasmic adaptor subunit [Pirellulales bacterium]
MTAIATLLLLVASVAYFSQSGQGGSGGGAVPEPPPERGAEKNSAPEGVVRLTPAKLKAAALHVSRVERREVQESRRVPGKIEYNKSRRLEIKVPAAGVVTRVLVLPGQTVKRGDQLALASSVDVGTARDEVVRAEADLRIAEREADWLAQIAHNTKALLKALEDAPDIKQIEEQFKDEVLGDQREKIISAYSKLRLATRASLAAASAKDALAERYVQERASAREVADASFRTACDKASFDAQQQLARSQANLAHAQRQLAVSRQKLKLLLGPFAEIAPGEQDESLCELIIRSPLDGKVEDRFVSDGAQFVASQPLFALANTDTLWVSAQIYEREWSALAGGDVKELKVESPALPDLEATAKVQFFSVGLSNETRAVPLVAELPNADNRLKPGMFAWVTVPLGRRHEALVVPAGAIMRHEEEAFAFVELSPGVYRKAVITPGLITTEFVEVLSGLKAGEKVVDQGAFFLKSELLLEGEEP